MAEPVTEGGAGAPHFAAGRAARARGAWVEALRHFDAAIAVAETPEAHEERASASLALFEMADAVAGWERAHELYAQRDDVRGMARMAIARGWGALAQRGDHAVCYGWLERARELLRDQGDTPEHGWLALREADLFHRPRHEIERARALTAEALASARRHGDCSLEMEALALEGVLLLRLGRIEPAIRELDHAAMIAASGRARDPLSTGTVLGHLLRSCEETEDYERSSQWFRLLDRLHASQPMPLFEGLCRSHLARLRIERGQWAEALRSLEAPIECTHYVRVRIALEWGLLRLREGRLDEAEGHFTRVGRLAESQLGLASIAWERGEAQTVKDLAERFLRALPAEDMLDRSLGLAWLARAHAALGDGVAACEAGSELTRIANTVGTPGLMADAHRVRGEVAAASGDHESARRHFEDAVDAAGRAGLPYQEAFARLSLARALRALGRDAAAAREATAAAEGYRSLGAEIRAQQAEAFAAPCAAAAPADEPPTLPLSERELEVLRLVAQGLSNKEIAVKLYLSEHTVKRHVANILTRLDLSSRAAAVAYAAKFGRL